MSQWDKLITDILKQSRNLRFEDLSKALNRIGYTMSQPSGGSSHHTFRKKGCTPITIPKQRPINKVYVNLVAEAVRQHLSESEDS